MNILTPMQSAKYSVCLDYAIHIWCSRINWRHHGWWVNRGYLEPSTVRHCSILTNDICSHKLHSVQTWSSNGNLQCRRSGWDWFRPCGGWVDCDEQAFRMALDSMDAFYVSLSRPASRLTTRNLPTPSSTAA